MLDVSAGGEPDTSIQTKLGAAAVVNCFSRARQNPGKVAGLWVEGKTGTKRQQERRRRQVMDGFGERVGWGKGFRAGSLLVCACVCVIICDGLGHSAAAAGSMLRSTRHTGGRGMLHHHLLPSLPFSGYCMTSHHCTFVP